MRYWGILSGTLGLLLTASVIAAGAQAWPQRPVTVIVPFTAGGNTDGIARMTGQRLSEKIANEIATAIKDPKFKEQLIQYGVDPSGNSPAEYKAMLEKDIAIWAEAVGVAGLKQN